MRRLRARAFTLALLHGLGASAQTPALEQRIQVTDCDPALAARLPSVVKLEIDVLLRERGPTRSPPENITVRCEEEKAHIEVTMENASRASTTDLHALAAEHRARAVALAAAELVHAMASDPHAAETTPSAVAAPVISPTEPRREPTYTSPASGSPRPELLVGALAEWRGKPSALLFGARMAFRSPLGKVVVPELSVDASFGEISTPSAPVSIQTLSAAAHVYFGTTTGDVRWDIGPGARIGAVHLAGRPDATSGFQGDTLTAVWGGPEVGARIAYGSPRLGPVLVALQLGAGIVALPVRGMLDATEPVYTDEGLWTSICAEVGLGF